MLVLTANKTKMLQLTQAMGYHPPRNAQFIKLYRGRHWWLEWFDATGTYEASLYAAAGKAVFAMRLDNWENSETRTTQTLSMETLQKFGLVEEWTPSSRAAAQRSEPDCEPEM